MPKKPIFLLLAIMTCSAMIVNAQFGSTNASPIWGNNNATLNISAPLYSDPNWGVLPSEQTLNNARRTENINISSNRRSQYRNSSGQLVLIDERGNILRDAYGNEVLDSTGTASGTMNSDADGEIPPPPDDPEDVPIDGGIGILIALGLVNGYQQTKRKKKPAITTIA